MACYIPDIFVEDFSKKCFECHLEAENFIDESFIEWISRNALLQKMTTLYNTDNSP